MKHLLIAVFSLAFLTMTSSANAQEEKTKKETTTGKDTKIKKEAGKTKVKKEGEDGKEMKIKTEGDTTAMMSEDAGRQVDTSAHAAMMGAFNLDMVRQEINTMNQAYGQAFVKGDSAALVDMYHSEAMIFPPNMAMTKMRTDVGKMASGNPAAGVQSMQLTTTDVVGGPELVVESGTYQMTGANNMSDRGKYMVVWKQENGKWKIYRDIWNSDMPAGQK